MKDYIVQARRTITIEEIIDIHVTAADKKAASTKGIELIKQGFGQIILEIDHGPELEVLAVEMEK